MCMRWVKVITVGCMVQSQAYCVWSIGVGCKVRCHAEEVGSVLLVKTGMEHLSNGLTIVISSFVGSKLLVHENVLYREVICVSFSEGPLINAGLLIFCMQNFRVRGKCLGQPSTQCLPYEQRKKPTS